jgi:predicted transcriptional regulator
MDELKTDSDNTAGRAADVARARGIAWEAASIAEADADIAAGRVVVFTKVKQWIDSIGTDHELPAPYAGR